MSAPELQVEGLDAAYGASQVLFGVKLEVERGDTLALMGRNGAGKSSTFKAIMGLLPPRAGRVCVRGQDVTGQPPYRIARAGLGFVPEDRQVFPEHTVAVGDGNNDIDMLRWARDSYAMGNAPQVVADAAGSVVGAVDQDGVLEVLLPLVDPARASV